MTNTARIVMTMLLVGLVQVAMSGCASMQTTDSAKSPTIEGRWKGTWLSDTNGHTGDLWCIVERSDDGSLTARYRGTYGDGIAFKYEVPMSVTPDGEILRFAAESDLGALFGGVYTYEGTIIGDVFHATYDSSVDKGTFDMTRLTGPIDQDDQTGDN